MNDTVSFLLVALVIVGVAVFVFLTLRATLLWAAGRVDATRARPEAKVDSRD